MTKCINVRILFLIFIAKNKETRYDKDEQIKYYFSLSLADFDNEFQYDDEMGYAYTDINFMFYVSFDNNTKSFDI